MQIKTRGGGFLEKGEIFHSKSHAKFLLLRNFYELEFHHNLFVYIYLRNCLKVVWKLSVPEYILTLKIDSTASVLP